MQRLVKITGRVEITTEDAIALRPPIYRGNIALDWIPRSAIKASSVAAGAIRPGADVEISVPLWLARQKGLVK